MKKLFYSLFTVLISMILISCEKDDIFDTLPTDANKPNYQSGLVIGRYTSNINSVKSMYDASIVHSIPTKQSVSKSDNSNYILIEDNDGGIDTLSLTSGESIKITGISEIYPINDNYLLFCKKNHLGIDITYEILTNDITTVYDSVKYGDTTTYVNIVDTTYVNGDMWLVYYDTIDVVVNVDYITHNYNHVLYNLNDGVFHRLDVGIKLFNERVMNSFNDPFYKNHDSSKFYIYNNYHDIIEVDLSGDVPTHKVIYDHTIYGSYYLQMDIVDDNIIYIDSDSGNQFKYVTKTGKQEHLNHDIIWDNDSESPYPLHFRYIMNDELYIIIEKSEQYEYYKFVYDSYNDSIYLSYVKSHDFQHNMEDIPRLQLDYRYIYKYSDDNYIYFFNYIGNELVTLSKNDLQYNCVKLNISNINGEDYQNPEFNTKMAEFTNGFIIYTKDAIYSVNTNSKSSISATPIASGYVIKTMTTNNNGLVVFYGKNPSGQDIRGIINADYTITETLVEYDSNGTLITNI